MKPLILLGLVVLFQLATGSTEKCYDSTEHCHSTNYQTYVDCVRKRHKRSTDCDVSCNNGNCINTCNDCDCNQCNYSNCDNSCNTCCSTCCSNYVSCRTNHCCHKTCHAQCDTTQCRSDCRKNCFNGIKKETVYVDGGGSSVITGNYSSNVNNVNKHNVTTIINLHNVINHTNIIDIPLAITNNNEQNITVNGSLAGGSVPEEKCCTVIGPRQCVSTPVPRCFHYRSKQCGEFCTATIVHKEQQQVCESMYPGAPPNCKQQIYYIPQPQPRCVYQSVWPYVSCGIQGKASCEGCYSHYVNQGSTNYMNCPNQCYDEGFNIGPMYRQGPVYRPWYYHMPCYSCYGYPEPFGGPSPYAYDPYGGYGRPLVPGYPWLYPAVDQGNPNISDLPANASTVYEPVMSVNSFGAPYLGNPYRDIRDVEIEVNVEEPNDVQAEVKIQKEGETSGRDLRSAKVSKKEVESVTTVKSV